MKRRRKPKQGSKLIVQMSLNILLLSWKKAVAFPFLYLMVISGIPLETEILINTVLAICCSQRISFLCTVVALPT